MVAGAPRPHRPRAASRPETARIGGPRSRGKAAVVPSRRGIATAAVGSMRGSLHSATARVAVRSTSRCVWARLLPGVAALLCVWGMAGCRAKPDRTSGPIHVWHAYRGAEEAALQQLLTSFDESDVVALAIPYDAFGAKLAAAVPLGEGPHLFIDSHERLGDYRRRGIVAPVGDALDVDGFGETTLAAITLDGAPHAVPLSQKSLALYVNRRLAPGGVPSSIEEIAALAPLLPSGVVALAHESMNPYAHAAFLHGFGGTMLTDDDRFGMVGDEAVASLRLVQTLIADGAVPDEADGALVTNLFRSGRAAYAISGPWLAADLGPDLDYEVAPLPQIEATGRPMQPFLTVEAIMLSPHGAQRSDVRALARHLGSAQAARLRQTQARVVSARIDVSHGDDRFLAAFAEQAKRARPMPTSAAMRTIWEPARQAVRKILRGQAEPSDALEEAKRRFDDVRRPSRPIPPSPWPGLVVLGALCMWGAWSIVRARARPEQLGERLRAVAARVPLRCARRRRRGSSRPPAARWWGQPQRCSPARRASSATSGSRTSSRSSPRAAARCSPAARSTRARGHHRSGRSSTSLFHLGHRLARGSCSVAAAAAPRRSTACCSSSPGRYRTTSRRWPGRACSTASSARHGADPRWAQRGFSGRASSRSAGSHSSPPHSPPTWRRTSGWAFRS
jgi:maltose-binding protein MalE